MFQWLFIAALAVIVVLGWILMKRFAFDRLQHFADQRKASSRLVTRGEFIDGKRHLPVSLALTDASVFYENADMQASLDLEWIHEVEYENELLTGQAVVHGKVLRLRSSSQVFEFVVPNEAVRDWETMLPPHRQEAALAH
jgi:hypothetical protein